MRGVVKEHETLHQKYVFQGISGKKEVLDDRTRKCNETKTRG